MLKRISLIALCLGIFMAGTAAARDISFTGGLNQDDFRSLSKEAGTGLAYRNTAPAEPLGITGFDAGVEVSAISIKTDGFDNYWQKAFGGDAPSYLYLPKIRVRKGLPLGIDIGAMYSYVPDSNIRLYGAEISKAILEGSVATPAVGVRATYTKLAGVDDLDLQTVGVDASISKGFVMFTPYAGAGGIWIDSKAKGNLANPAIPGFTALKSEQIWQPRVFGGLKFSPLPLFAITAEAEYSARPIYSFKAAIGF